MVLSEEQVATGMANLVERFADRLTPKQLDNLARYRDVGEWLLTVQTLLGALRQEKSPVSTREREELGQYLATFATARLPERLMATVRQLTEDLAQLTVITSLTEREANQRARLLPKAFGNRIPDEDRGELADAMEARDWSTLTETTVDLLSRHRIPVSPDERRTLWLLLDAMDLPRSTLARLTEG
jgi:hypothetical protein